MTPLRSRAVAHPAHLPRCMDGAFDDSGAQPSEAAKALDRHVEDVKRWIVAERKQPGHRLPNEKELIELFGYSKSTVREALEGARGARLISFRTGPGGGAYLQQGVGRPCVGAVRNFLHFHHLDATTSTAAQGTEPELAVSVVGRLTPEHLRGSKNVRLAHQPTNETNYARSARPNWPFTDARRACPNPCCPSCAAFSTTCCATSRLQEALDHHPSRDQCGLPTRCWRPTARRCGRGAAADGRAHGGCGAPHA